MSSDHQEIMELLEGIDAHNPATYSQYAKVEWRWIDDANNNNYNTSNILPTANTATSFPQINQIIKMDTKALIDKWIGYRQAFWYVPLTYTLGGTVNATVFSAPTIGAFASTPTAVVAIKNGLYQLVHALIISINGQQLNKLQSNYINMANHLHALIETSVDYAMSVGTFSGFKKDTLETLLNAGAPVGAAAISNVSKVSFLKPLNVPTLMA